jgi:predicted nucleic acid-binding protein
MRLVLDTNVWLDWLVFGDAEVAPLRAAVARGRARVFIDAACEAELARVLAYPLGRLRLDAQAQAACLAECRRIACRGERAAAPAWTLPACRDPDDQKFLELARDCGADLLLTKDRALLELARRTPFRIVTPRACAALVV